MKRVFTTILFALVSLMTLSLQCVASDSNCTLDDGDGLTETITFPQNQLAYADALQYCRGQGTSTYLADISAIIGVFNDCPDLSRLVGGNEIWEDLNPNGTWTAAKMRDGRVEEVTESPKTPLYFFCLQFNSGT